MENYGLIILLVVGFAFLIWFITTSNKIKGLSLKIEEGESNIDVALTKRYDMINQMYQSVKGAVKHESETLTKVVELRKKSSNCKNMKERENLDNMMTQATREIDVLVENYPDLKANESFIKLKKAIANVEENLQASRRIYNSNVTYYNKMIVMFPSSIAAKVISASKKEYFEQTNAEKRETVDLSF